MTKYKKKLIWSATNIAIKFKCIKNAAKSVFLAVSRQLPRISSREVTDFSPHARLHFYYRATTDNL